MSAVGKRVIRLLIAFLLAPIGPGLLFMTLALFSNPGEGIWALGFFAMLYYPAMLVLGVPTHFLLVRRNWIHGWSYALAGLVIGAIVDLVFFERFFFSDAGRASGQNQLLMPSDTILLIISALLGALTAWTFWLIARPNREPIA